MQLLGRRGAVTALLLAVAALVASVAIQPAAADVDVFHRDGQVFVRLNDTSNSPKEILAAVRGTGLDIQIQPAPAPPSRIGRFVGFAEGSGAGALHVTGGTQASYVEFSLPEGWKGTATVYLGRAAKPGELYKSGVDAFEDGEPLACSATQGQPLTKALALLRDIPHKIIRRTDSSDAAVSLEEALAKGYGSLPLATASMSSSTTIYLEVGPQVSITPPADDTC